MGSSWIGFWPPTNHTRWIQPFGCSMSNTQHFHIPTQSIVCVPCVITYKIIFGLLPSIRWRVTHKGPFSSLGHALHGTLSKTHEVLNDHLWPLKHHGGGMKKAGKPISKLNRWQYKRFPQSSILKDLLPRHLFFHLFCFKYCMGLWVARLMKPLMTICGPKHHHASSYMKNHYKLNRWPSTIYT
jgi:hypothetical protein